jgi:hypothetical protein
VKKIMTPRTACGENRQRCHGGDQEAAHF